MNFPQKLEALIARSQVQLQLQLQNSCQPITDFRPGPITMPGISGILKVDILNQI